MSDEGRSSMCEECLCRCGHVRSSHYDYILNGRDQGRCQECDPTAGLRSGNYVMEGDTYAAAMYAAADHWFEPAAAEPIEFHELTPQNTEDGE